MRRKELELFRTCSGSLQWLDISVNCFDTGAFSGFNTLVIGNTHLTHVTLKVLDLIPRCAPTEVMIVELIPDDILDEYSMVIADAKGEKAICDVLESLSQSTCLREVEICTHSSVCLRWGKIDAVKNILARSFRWGRWMLKF